MASLSKPAPARRLVELLQEQQEPFLLDIYLLEKGYSKKIPTSDARNNSWIGDCCRKLLRLSSSSSKKSSLGNSTSKLLRSALKKLIFDSNTSNYDDKTSTSGRSSLSSCDSNEDKITQVVKLNPFSSDSHSSDFKSHHDSNEKVSSTKNLRSLDLCNLKKPASVDRKLQCGCTEDCRQFSPVSVLEPLLDEEFPVYNHKEFRQRTTNGANPSALDFDLTNEVLDYSMLSASLWDLLRPGSSQKVKNRRVLQQIRQLIFDCVREVVENQARKESWHLNARAGPEMLGKIVFDQILSWGKQCVDKSNITQMIDIDFSESGQLRKNLQPQIKEIGIEIGDSIFEELRDEIVKDMFDVLFSERC